MPVYYSNYDLEKVVTPVNVPKLIGLLKEAEYDASEIDFLEKGFTEGFDIGYEGPQTQQSKADNIPITVGSETQLWNKLMKEVKLNRVAGPFSEIPFENYIQSPIGLVPKAGSDQTWLIFHLSYDCKKDGLKSVNFFMPKEKCTIKYKDLDHAVGMYLSLVEEALVEEENEVFQNVSTSADAGDYPQDGTNSRGEFSHHK